MKIRKNKIVEATEKELFKYYMDSDWYQLLPFDEYLKNMKEHGCKIIEENEEE